MEGTSKVDLNADLPYFVQKDIINRNWGWILFFGTEVPLICDAIQHGKSNLLTYCSILFLWLLVCIALQWGQGVLSLDHEGIHFKTRFKSRDIRWAEIDHIVSGTQDFNLNGLPTTGDLGMVNPNMGPFLMIFYRKDGGEPFLLNFKPYTVKGLATLVHFVTVKAPHAKLDEKTLKIMNGIFPSVFFGEQKGYG